MNTSFNPGLRIPLLENESQPVAKEVAHENNNTYVPLPVPGAESHSMRVVSPQNPLPGFSAKNERKNFTAVSSLSAPTSWFSSKKIQNVSNPEKSASNVEKARLNFENKPRLSQQDENEIAFSNMQREAGYSTYKPPKAPSAQ